MRWRQPQRGDTWAVVGAIKTGGVNNWTWVNWRSAVGFLVVNGAEIYGY